MNNINNLESKTKLYSLWLDSPNRESWITSCNINVDDLNKECEILRNSEYPTQEDTLTALLYGNSEKLEEIREKRAEVDQKYPRVNLD